MKIWHCSYYWRGRYGAYQEYECVVIAEIKSKAIGMALMHYEDSDVIGWSAKEILLDKELVHEISSSSN